VRQLARPNLFPVTTIFSRSVINTFKLPENQDFFLKTPEFEKISFSDMVEKYFEKFMPEERLTGVSGDWATALFSYGGIHKARDQIENDLRKLHSEEYQKLSDTLMDRATPYEESKKLLNEFISKVKPHKQTVLFLEKALEDDLLWLVPRISEKFFDVMNDLNGVKEGVIYSAKSMTKDELSDVIDFCQRVYLNGKKLRAIQRTDPNLLGGWELRTSENVHGHTHNGKIKRLKSMYTREVDDLNKAMEKALSKI
jgi:F0F1-type ATP synthase delta subunit